MPNKELKERLESALAENESNRQLNEGAAEREREEAEKKEGEATRLEAVAKEQLEASEFLRTQIEEISNEI